MPLSEVINPARYDDAEWMEIHREIESYSPDKHVFKHTSGEVYRKGWEWTQAAYGLRKLGFINDTTKGVGVGAGHEAVIFWLADRCKHVTATDLYGNEEWSSVHGKEADASILSDATKFATKPFDTSRVSFRNADGTNLWFDDNAFDFAWSLSSIEHFGGHDESAQAVREMGRVVKPGGVVCIATEMLLLDEYQHPEYFTRAEIEEYIIGASPALKLVDGMNWTLPPHEYLIDQICLRSEGIHRRRRHVVLNDGYVQWTSVIVFLIKSGS